MDRVAEVAHALGLSVRREVRVGKRLWGAERRIDLVLTHEPTRKLLGLECKFQRERGTTEEKLPSVIQDIGAWPIPGLVVFDGDGFTPNMRAYLHSTGKAVELDDLADWLRLFFALPEKEPQPALPLREGRS